ncbi:dihydrolipoyl dehydrogenase [Sulfuriferula plumbiphila]|uniref:Dihydrolipoyl dehydrogenase n=1 Tax=Sulfuriferula plumbiphila TaxID=171865 RepID=A0A512L3P7_9PROT|nr:NAD(P)/FAD-dependent oxidoreductase [Sulfuriferula plumbiphila]BBP02795.1 dihydrolipoyl dehydrogenase [Sulfuriferula plumbiphila]GEP29089.1 dihydrolipoyl dehydrogenase [Sulfuriferula plumbiphila]
MQQFDLIVIGSGPGGYRAAVLSTLRGLSVAIIEKADWGGCCLNRGCVPKKDWHHTAQLVAASRHFTRRGISGVLSAELDGAWQHQKKVVETVRDSYTDYMKRLGIGAFNGAANFVDAHTVAVGEASLNAKHIIIATGSSPLVPDAYPLTPGRVLTTDDLFNHAPPAGKRVAVVGSGVIGTEFAFILSQLGREVLWIANSKPLAGSAYSQPALKILHEALARHDIQARTGCRAEYVEVLPDGVRLALGDGSVETVDWVLLGTGRRPHTDNLVVDAAGVALDAQGYVKVNAYLQTSVPHIYAIGDVANPRMTANQALADAAVAVANILSSGSRQQDAGAVPELVYSAVELGRIGMNEDDAEDAGLEPAVGFAAFETNPRALGQDDTDGFVRLIADMDSGALLGAEVVGAEAGEMIHAIAQQFGHDDALARFAGMFYNHPARTEEIQNATETLAAKWGLAQQVFGE